jgi:enterochelin esterase-like enzyme
MVNARSARRLLIVALLCLFAVAAGAVPLLRASASSSPRRRLGLEPRPATLNAGDHGAGGGHQRARLAQIDPRLEARVTGETGGTLTTVHFYSQALHKEADYVVFTPAGYGPGQALPVFYMLHGMPGMPMGFTTHAETEVRLEQLIRAGVVRPMILVFPDGRIDGRTQSDSEWANTQAGNYESLVADIVRNVDQRYATLPCRQERALAGLSAGAYGAANVGLHQVDLFGLVQVWSGYFTETHNGVFAHADPATMAYNSPIDYVRTMRGALRRYPLRIFVYAGRDDHAARQVPAMAAALQAEGAHESWALYPGGHSWKTWTPHVDQMLIMASNDFARPLDGGSASCSPPKH